MCGTCTCLHTHTHARMHADRWWSCCSSCPRQIVAFQHVRLPQVRCRAAHSCPGHVQKCVHACMLARCSRPGQCVGHAAACTPVASLHGAAGLSTRLARSCRRPTQTHHLCPRVCAARRLPSPRTPSSSASPGTLSRWVGLAAGRCISHASPPSTPSITHTTVCNTRGACSLTSPWPASQPIPPACAASGVSPRALSLIPTLREPACRAGLPAVVKMASSRWEGLQSVLQCRGSSSCSCGSGSGSSQQRQRQRQWQQQQRGQGWSLLAVAPSCPPPLTGAEY